MKKLLSALIALIVIIITCFPNRTAVFAENAADTQNAAAENAKAALSSTLSYYESYLGTTDSFDMRGYEDVLLTLIADASLKKESSACKAISEKAITYASANINESAEFYALMILISDYADNAGGLFNSINPAEKFASLFSAYDTQNPTMNPYWLKYIAAVLDRYGADIQNAGALKDKLKSIIMSYYKNDASGTGLDCWGYGISVDDTGAVLPALQSLYRNGDPEVKSAVDNCITWALTQLKSDGTVDAFGAVSSDSTGLLLHMLSSYGSTKSEANFNGLLTLKDETAGMYISEYDKHYATRDAFYGLISYYLYVSDGGYFLDKPASRTPGAEVTNPENPMPENKQPSENQQPAENRQPVIQNPPLTGDSTHGYQTTFIIISVICALLYIYSTPIKSAVEYCAGRSREAAKIDMRPCASYLYKRRIYPARSITINHKNQTDDQS